MPESVEAYELEQRAALLSRVTCRWAVLHDDDAEALVAFIGQRPGALVVMATHARGVIAERMLGSVSEAVVARSGHAVLLVGPHVSADARPTHPMLVVGVDWSVAAEHVLPAVASWVGTFAGAAPWLVEALPPSSTTASGQGGDLESAHVHHLAARLQQLGIEAQWEVIHGRAADALIDLADQAATGVAYPVLVVASQRWTDPDHHHWVSTARKLTHQARHPVLVVPVHRPL